ncbi:putative serine/threonine-protein kinase PBL28 [Nicotiana tabacum]|uniref:non-specific serine/threonine protein kinase n=1 Tax=Nicotiana tabacum TaxID=4097 RepID=A0A1S4BWS3_TOBAC|nr:probable serine/threonine-protein kinase PBL28 [Nicotiana tomentosiformis]XP_016493219.1 PREDICTED: serine/threonine-protein kinase PBS1-like [Nicotiana tabacum]
MPFGLVAAWNKRRRSRSEDQLNPWIYKSVECWKIEDQNPPAKRHHGSSVFTLKEMEEATNSFSDDNLLGKGGFGRVYKGTLRSGEIVAIKKMDLPSFKEAEGEREFRVEVDILSRLDHPHLVQLIGYCADGKHRFLVYEYMHKGNLQDHLNGIGEVKMDWPLRLKVAIGAARGLAYLHSSSAVGIPIIHRDFKSTNILLNTNYEAKISDFGLAKLMPEGQETCVTSRVLGTFGYFDPEYTLTGKLTLQSDVYAFGVVMLELLTGRRAVDLTLGPNDQNLVLQVRHILNDKKKLRKVIDPEINRSSYTMESVTMFANLASRSVRADSSERPSMVDCVKELQLILHTNMKGLSMPMHTFRMI